jgi:Na+-driven multidrug efflux pump
MGIQVREVARPGRYPSGTVAPGLQARRLLEGPVLPTLLRLAAPTVALMLLQGVVAAGEAAFVGRLGSAALAGVSLSFPIDSLFALMACGLVAYGVVLVAVMRRELGLRPERS